MTFRFARLSVFVLLSVAATSFAAHHSVASEFDSFHTMPITGMITRVDWTNPHVWMRMSVKDRMAR
jgi:hypothetical protein